MKRLLVLTLLVFVAFGATVASAAWGPAGSGTGASTSRSLGVPTSVAATATGGSSIQITWAAPGGASPAPSQYIVRRTAPTTVTVCTVSAPTLSCNDTGLAGSTTYSYTVQSLLGTNWDSAQSGVVSATTTAPPNFKVTTTAGNKTAGTAFTVTVTATTNGTTTDTGYSGFQFISWSGASNSPSGSAPSYPFIMNFTNGVATGSVTLKDAETPTLTATDGTLSGSLTVTVVAGAASQIQFSSSSLDCTSGSVTVGNQGPWTTKVTVYDALLNPKNGTARTVTLTRSPANGTWSPTSLTITAANSETTTSSTYTRAPGNGDVTVTATNGTFTDTCVVKK